MREQRTDVLVVGAGPVGLWTALLAARAGLDVRIIDREERTAACSYACALHPRTLEVLDRLGLAELLLPHGRRIQTIAFYEGNSRRAELQLSELGGKFPFLLVLPQDLLEWALEDQLREAGVPVHWHHRFDSFQAEPESIVATVEELGGTSTGYIVPHWEELVKGRSLVQAGFLVGADGPNSLVRQRAGIENEHAAGPALFAAYEFDSATAAPEEARVVIDETTTNVLWPLLGERCRWTFQLVQSDFPKGFPNKERRAVRLLRQGVDEQIRQYVQRVTEHRAPWFSAGVQEVTWCKEVAFEQRVARQFGRERCWLAGDAAHQTGPVGVQSLNAGLAEAVDLVECMRKIQRENASPDLLAAYQSERQAQWRRLLGLTGGLTALSDTSPWVRARCARLLPCLPGTAANLEPLAQQLKLQVN